MQNVYYTTRKVWASLMQIGARFGCHQMPERSFFYKDYQFPVCARCNGVFVGELSVFLLYLFGRVLIPPPVALALACVMLFDWAAQQISRYEGTNTTLPALPQAYWVAWAAGALGCILSCGWAVW